MKKFDALREKKENKWQEAEPQVQLPKKKKVTKKPKQKELTPEEQEKKQAREKKEAERRRIDAEGKAAANRILNESLTDKILREKGILATEELAKSQNTKVIVIGNSNDGLPIILGDN